jgi:di/tricarboxylate transporter
MSPALASLGALVLAIVISMTSRTNVGWMALAFAWIIGVYLAGLDAAAVMAGFPVSLFLTLAGVTVLFAIADTNATLELLARRAIALARGSARQLPLLFFAIACLLSSLGPGAISSVALLAPLAMVIGLQSGVPPVLTALMVANGANAGNLSPVSAVGVIANSRMAEAGLGGHEGKVWFANFAAHCLVAGLAWLIFRPRTVATPSVPETPTTAVAPTASVPLSSRQRLTLAVIAAWIVSVLVFQVSLGLSAFAAVSVLLVAGVADEVAVVRRAPWGVIMMVCGVSVLIALLERTGGMELFTGLLGRLANPATVNGVIAFVAGAISTYSSTAGVVLPALLPTVPGLVAEVGGGDPLAVALSLNIGASVVDVAPFSTLGALCVAAVAEVSAARQLFRQLMAWALAMTVVGAIIAQLLAGWLARF